MVPGLGAPGYLAGWARALALHTTVVVLDLPRWRWGRARACPPTVRGIAEAIEDVVGESRLPLLILTGRGDRMAPPCWAQELAGRAGPMAHFEVMPGGHNFCYPDPERAAAVVLRWLATLP